MTILIVILINRPTILGIGLLRNDLLSIYHNSADNNISITSRKYSKRKLYLWTLFQVLVLPLGKRKALKVCISFQSCHLGYKVVINNAH